MMFLVSFFENLFANTLIAEDLDFETLAELIKDEIAPTKDAQRSLKLARLGGNRLPNGCLRHTGNIIAVSGCELDYDGEEMPFDEACARLDDHGLAYLAYTTARHTPATPRYRFLLPFSKELPPGQRSVMVSRANGVLGGVLSKESWVLPTAFFFSGGIAGYPEATIVISDGEETIDLAIDLDANAMPYQAPAGQAGGQAGGKGGTPDFDMLSEPELIELIQTGQHYYHPAMRLAAIWQAQGVTEADAQANLEVAFDAVPSSARDKKWSKGRSSIPRWVKTGYARAAKQQGKFFQGLVDYLENGVLFKGAIRFNRFARRIEVSDPFPPQPGQTIGDTYRALEDPADTLETMINVQANGFPKVGKSTVFDATYLAGVRHACHPVRDYLDSLKWKAHIHRLFLDYIPGALPDRGKDPKWHDRVLTYLEAIGRCFMIGAVARIFQPGCKLDHLPILISPQGWNKSKALAALVPDVSWFSDDLPANVSDKDSKLALDGKMLIELAELPHLRREVDRVKAFFSRATDRYRVPYGRLPADWPRQCTFIATVNELEFPDVTGNRRFWPILLAGPVKDGEIARDRDQLWAEAVHRYRHSEQYWLTPEVEKIAREIQDEYVESDVRDEPIEAWIAMVTPEGETPRFTVREVLEKALGFRIDAKTDPGDDPRPLASAADEKRVIRRLRRLGYRPEPHQTRVNGERLRFWVPVED